MEEFEDFFKAAKTRIARLGYMIWDIYTCPAGIPGQVITYSISDGMNAPGGASCTAELTNRIGG